jgi:hypothetical protein
MILARELGRENGKPDAETTEFAEEERRRKKAA